MSGPVGLSTVEAWDLPALQAAVGGLSGVPDVLGGWTPRLDALADQLRTTALWSGPAADVAATALVELSAVAGRVRLALADSADSLGVVVTGVGTAQEEAARARSWAASGPVVLSDAGLVAPVAVAVMTEEQRVVVAEREHAATRAEGHAREALVAAGAVLTAARLSGEPLVAAGATAGPVDFGGVAEAAAAAVVAPVVPAVDPAAAARWWAGLTPAEQQAATTADPTGVGALDGLPAAARDQANRLLLADALAHPERDGAAVARAVADRLADLDPAGTTQLLLFVPDEDLAALAVGDLDTAGAVGVLVPGMTVDPGGDLGGATGDAVAVRELAQAAVPGLAVATLVWMGYRTPSWGSFFSALNARSAGPVLDRTLDGLAASRGAGARAGGPPVPRTTLIAHSYGSLVAGEAARAEGELAADALVLLGSPGTGSHDAGGLEAEEVYGAWSPLDPVSTSDWFGGSPFDSGFGDTGLPTSPVQLHTQYYSPSRPTLAAIADVVAGTRDPG